MGIVLLRTIFVYLLVILAIRIMGKRQLGELQPSEFVVTILISNLATLSIEDTNVPLLGTILPILMLVICEVGISILTLKFSRMRRFISGNFRIIIRDGVVDESEMRNLRWSIDDIMEQLRQNGVFDIDEVALAIVETSGSLSTYLKYSARPVTPATLEMPDIKANDLPPIVIISDGEILAKSLAYCNLKPEWVQGVLAGRNIKASDVFIMTCDNKAQYNITLRTKEKGK